MSQTTIEVNKFSGISYVSWAFKSIVLVNRKNLIISLVSFFVAVIFSEQNWYKVVLRYTYFCKIKDWLKFTPRPQLAIVRAQHIDDIFFYLYRVQKFPPLKYTILRQDDLSHATGIVLCTFHVPFTAVSIRSLLEMNFKIDGVIVRTSNKENKIVDCCKLANIPMIDADFNVLIKAKNVLQKNGSVLLMADNSKTGVFSPNMFHLCRLLNSKLIFFFAALNDSGIIDVRFIQAPNPYCETELAVEDNLLFLKQLYKDVLANYAHQSIF